MLIDAAGPELDWDRLLARAAALPATVLPLHNSLTYLRDTFDVDVSEPGPPKGVGVLVDRDRPCDAPGPRVEARLRFRRQLAQRDHVGHREAPARPQHPMRFAEHGGLVGGQVDDAVRDHDVDARVGKGDLLDRALEEGRVEHAGPRLVVLREADHLVGHVHAVRVAARGDAPGRQEDVDAGAAPQVEHRLSGMQVDEERRVAAA